MFESSLTFSEEPVLAACRLLVHPDLRQGGALRPGERVAEIVLTSWRGLVELHERVLTQYQ